MNRDLSLQTPTRVRYGVLGFACSLSMITYLDRVCFGTVASNIQGEFGLSETQKGWLFSAFALAYAAFEVPSGWLGDVYGPKKTLIRIVLCWSLFTVFTGLIYPDVLGPSLAFACLLVIRFLFGMGEAGAYPNIARAFHNWFPFQERGSAKGAVWMAGRFAGGVTSFLVLAMLFETTVDGKTTVHWRHVFWIFGVMGVIWCGFFWWWFRDRPDQKAEVNQAEIDLIRHGEDHTPAAAVPWRTLLTSGNLWVLCMMYFCAAYGWYFNITYLPGYLRDYFGRTAGERWSADYWAFSLMAGAPLLLGSVACLVGGLLSDFFIKRTGNRRWGRRLFGVIGHALCACSYLAAVFAENVWLFVLAIALAAFWNDITMGAAWASCLDIGKRYSGIVAGCMNTIGNVGGFFAGFLTGWIIDQARAPAIPPAAAQIVASVGMLSGPTTLPIAASQATPLASIGGQLLDASRPGWTINFCIFAAVYAIATVLWFFFDSTKPVVPPEREAAPTLDTPKSVS